MGESFEAETDGKSTMWIKFEKPDKKDIIQAFEIVDISPAKGEPPDASHAQDSGGSTAAGGRTWASPKRVTAAQQPE